MFIEIRQFTTMEKDLSGKDLCKTTRIIYCLSGQEIDQKVLHPKTQELYKKIYNIQEQKSLEKGYPITIFELLLTNEISF